MDVTILGAGPAGLLAAHAAEQRGARVRIIAKGEPSPIGGAQYLHNHVPGVTDNINPEWLTYTKVGTEKGYAIKAYGEPEAQVSWDVFVTGDYPSWSLKDAYERLWERFGKLVESRAILPEDVDEICHGADVVFSSIPLPTICMDSEHEFPGQEVVFTEEPFVAVNNLIVYNGRLEDKWYRAACLFGYSSTEYAVGNNGDIPEDVWKQVHYRGVKPVASDCNCHSRYPNLIRIGRFGRWLRGIHVDDAYRQVYERVS